MQATDKHRVLVLDGDMLVINHVNWKQAIDILLDEEADVLREYKDVFITTATKAIPTPAVIRLRYRSSFKRVRRVSYSANNVFYRDNNTCQYCGQPLSIRLLDIEHVVPRSRGGKTEYKNVVAACRPCNSYKKNMTPQEAGMKLRTKPDNPKYLPVIRTKEIPSEWNEYLANDIGIFVKDGKAAYKVQ